MGLYEAAKDALSLAQKADNIELVQKIMDVQREVLEMQHQLQLKNEEALSLKEELKSARERKKYVYEEEHKWLVNPENPGLKLCPTCMNRDNFESPLGSADDYGHRYCGNCKNSVN